MQASVLRGWVCLLMCSQSTHGPHTHLTAVSGSGVVRGYGRHAWGVDTMTAPERLRRWEMLSWASPVPGGMSMTSTSRAPQLTLLMKVSMALITMGPRHTAALSSCTQPGTQSWISTVMTQRP